MDWTQRVGRRLTPRDLHVFMAVAETRSMGRAAERLAISRPVISRTISELEALLAVRLFDRTSAGMEPTIFGQSLLTGGRAVFDELRQTVQSLASLSDPNAGTLRIGCSEVNAAGIVARTVQRLSEQFPRMRFFVQSSQVLSRMQLLRERRVDLFVARLASPDSEGDLDYLTLTYEQLRVVCGERSPLLKRTKLTLADLVGERWIHSSPEISPGGPVAEAFRAANLPIPEDCIVSDSLNFRNSMLALGDFITMMPQTTLRLAPLPSWLRVLPVQFPEWRVPTVIATIRGRTLTPAANLFIQQAREITSHIVGGEPDGRNA